MSADSKVMSEWVAAVVRELGIGAVEDPVVDTLLALTADVAHGVSRPAAPVTAFLIGIAAGRADDPAIVAWDLAPRISVLAENWDSWSP